MRTGVSGFWRVGGSMAGKPHSSSKARNGAAVATAKVGARIGAPAFTPHRAAQPPPNAAGPSAPQPPDADGTPAFDIVPVSLLLHDTPIQSLAALIVALGSAFGPKICADFIHPKAQEPGQSPLALS